MESLFFNNREPNIKLRILNRNIEHCINNANYYYNFSLLNHDFDKKIDLTDLFHYWQRKAHLLNLIKNNYKR